MPYTVRKLPNKSLYRVFNNKTRHVFSYGTTLQKAKAQIRLLKSKEYSKKKK